MELINPNCSAVRPNESPNCGKMPARMEKVKAVVMRAKQLPLKSAVLLMFSLIKLMVLTLRKKVMLKLSKKQYINN